MIALLRISPRAIELNPKDQEAYEARDNIYNYRKKD